MQAGEKRGLDFTFELLELLAYGRRGDMECFSSSGDAEAGVDMIKNFEPVEVWQHKKNLI